MPRYGAVDLEQGKRLTSCDQATVTITIRPELPTSSVDCIYRLAGYGSESRTNSGGAGSRSSANFESLIPMLKKNYPLFLSIVCWLIAVWMGIRMYQQTQQQELWWVRPLFLFLGVYGGVSLLLLARFSRYPEQSAFFALATLSGVLLGIGFPGFSQTGVLLLFAWVGLLWLDFQLGKANVSGWVVFRYAFHTFILWNILSTYWVANASLPAGLFAILVNSLLMTVPFVLGHLTRKVMPRLGYVPFLAYWISFEYFHFNWELTWPWLTLGNGLAGMPWSIQWYEYTGVLGGTFWILLVNILLLQLILHYRQAWRNQASRFFQALLVLIVPVAGSIYQYQTHQERGPGAEVVLVQPNYEPHFEKGSVPDQMIMERYLELSRRALTDTTDLLVFPEASFGLLDQGTFQRSSVYHSLSKALVAHPSQVQLLSGISAYRRFSATDSLLSQVRTQVRRGGDTLYYEVYNAAAWIDFQDSTARWYRKSKLVPGPEIFPYRDFLFFLTPILDRLGGTTAGLGTQDERTVFETKAGALAPVICYESVFGEFLTRYVRRGAEGFVIMTNDGWWDNTSGHRQHAAYASLRAIETRRSIVRAANTGISAFVNQRGGHEQRLRYEKTGALRGRIRQNTEITFYVRWGNLIGRVSLFASLIFLLNLIAQGRIGVRKKKN